MSVEERLVDALMEMQSISIEVLGYTGGLRTLCTILKMLFLGRTLLKSKRIIVPKIVRLSET